MRVKYMVHKLHQKYILKLTKLNMQLGSCITAPRNDRQSIAGDGGVLCGGGRRRYCCSKKVVVP